MSRLLVAAFCLVGAVGCGKSNDGVKLPDTPAPQSKPALGAEAAYRPSFVIGGKSAEAGTAFVVKAPSGKLVALTACHVLDKGEWASLQSTSLATMTGTPAAEMPGRPAFVGRSFDELPPIESGGRLPLMNTSEDFAAWVLPPGAAVKPLELADHEPRVNEWVWIVGQEPGRPLTLFLAKVTRVKGGTYMMQQHDRFNARGFSGGPVIDADGRVVGTTLAADPQAGLVQGATVAAVRQRIAGY